MANAEKIVQAEFESALKLQNARKLDEAEAAYYGVLTVQPDHADAQHNLGLIKLDRGQPGQALAYLQYAIKLNPAIAEAHNTLGNAWRSFGKTTEAEAAYRRATDIKPSYALAWFNLGNLLADSQQLQQAEAAYRKALAARPDYAEAMLNLSNVLRTQNRKEEALKLLKKLTTAAPKYELGFNNLGNLHRDLDDLENAQASYRRAAELNPQYALAWLNLGTVLNHLGRKADSVTALRRAIEVAPRFGEPYMQLASTMKVPLDAPVVASMQFYYDEPAIPARDKMHLAFALGRVFNDNGQYDKAFDYFREGNRLKRASLTFNIAGEEALMERTRAVFTKEFFAKAPRSAVNDETPVFIVGMMRSGTTLMEQILASHPQVAGADELQWIPEIAFGFKPKSGQTYPDWLRSVSAKDLTAMGEAYIGRLRQRFGDGPRLITDKLPGNFLFVGLIHLILPNAKIIHMRRDPYDVCLSIYSTLFAQMHHYAYDMHELAQFYQLYSGLMNHWDKVLPGRILHQRYEDLVGDPERVVRMVLDYCNLPFDEKCLEFYNSDRRVRTASSQQVREQLHTRSIGRWRNYEKHLGEWKAMLASVQ
ncbi:MAG: sulfotransferase [Hyphomicrobiales bacterium]